ncbi:hypothetical protein QTP70_032825, partial [Hemibagrus guttatus]
MKANSHRVYLLDKT